MPRLTRGRARAGAAAFSFDFFFGLCLLLGLAPGAQAQQAVPDNPGFASSLLGRPADWPGTAADLFAANYAYPAAAGDFSAQPWLVLDPRKPGERAAYYDAVLAYGLTAFQGDVTQGCPKVSAQWFHAPWMTLTFGASKADLAQGQIGSGREPVCGLTQERAAPVGFLHPKQTHKVQSWAVGMFNQPGGYLLGRIWRDRAAVDLSEMRFPNGSFIIKYLFTEATEAEVPYLKGTPVWQANVYSADGASTRKTKPMRLAQIDFGIRDGRMDGQTGWVYGTFLYVNRDGAPVPDWRKNLVPVGAMWGNDPGVTKPADYVQQALNPDVVQLRDSGALFDPKLRKTFGWYDRVNGPIDNPASACLSCHGTAQVHKALPIKQFILPALKAPTDANKMLWFRNTKAGEPFVFSAAQLKLVDQGKPSSVRADWTPALMADFVSTDYSLQVRMAIETARAYAAQQALATLVQVAPMAQTQNSNAALKMQSDFKKESKRIERAGVAP